MYADVPLAHFQNTRRLFEDYARWIFLRKIHWNAVASVNTNSENALAHLRQAFTEFREGMLLNEGRYKRGHGLFRAHHRRLWRQDGRTQIPVSVVARAKGMAQIAEQTGLSREQPIGRSARRETRR